MLLGLVSALQGSRQMMIHDHLILMVLSDVSDISLYFRYLMADSEVSDVQSAMFVKCGAPKRELSLCK